ncbi:hypothetical protein [Falsiroseomonas selenitidurans]|uniref:Lipoprotein n=1 Tax=Falsiroseomonas selenitidurans TaxID=2716335 RepID=A0ABX1DXR7_9PROT|nr:hypothetical protein [Falsiroseomonas selenitidurans]NKC29581.1 hypothetical protein [Falsiroseomonas selenitidurans]
MRGRRLGLALLGLAGLLGACTEADQGPGAQTGRIGTRPTLEELAGRLPAESASFVRGDTVWHERERPGLGVAVDYAGPARSAVATVSLYDRGQAAVPQDIGAPAVQAEFTRAVEEALAMADRRTSQTMAATERSELAVPGQAPLQCARLQGTYGRQPVQTLLCVGAAAGHFLKVQVTSPGRQVRPVDPMPFVVGIAQAARG